MAQVVTLEGFTPPARYDSIPWTQARIEEGDAIDGTFVALETIAITPVDVDPSAPASRSFTTELASETPDLWYRIVFLDATGDDTLPTTPIQNGAQSPYLTVEELARKLNLNANTYRDQLQRVIDAASYEVDQEIGRSTALNSFELSLATEVTLERAVEHWQQGSTPFGFIGLGGGESGGVFVTSDSWNRHAHKLAPLKQSWGIA